MNALKNKSFLIVGSSAKGALEISYFKALKYLNYEVEFFDAYQEEALYIKGGKFGKLFQSFLPIEQWIRKMNRKLVVHCIKKRPTHIFYVTNVRVLTGTIACLKTIMPETKHALIWPDTPLNLEKHVLSNAPLYDITATYSSSSIDSFRALGFNNVIFNPLAADPFTFETSKLYKAEIFDIGFVGGWRPEREAVMTSIAENFPQLSIAIYGPYWARECKDAKLKKLIKGNGLYEKELADFFKNTKININIIDDTNFPAANMRFFEVLTSEGLQLTSSCPEMADIFKEKEHLVYFNSIDEISIKINWILTNQEKVNQIKVNAKKLIDSNHTYTHRVQKILEHD